jgi:hypothetical protein
MVPPEPNNPVELTAHSAGFVHMCGSVPVGRSSPPAFGVYGKQEVGMRPTQGDDDVV